MNCRTGFVINPFSNGTNDLVMNLERGVKTSDCDVCVMTWHLAPLAYLES